MSFLSAIDSSGETLQHLVAMAEGQRLLSSIRVKETPVDQTGLLKAMEALLREYTTTLSTKDLLYNKEVKQTAYTAILTLLDSFDIRIKESFKRLWEAALFKSIATLPAGQSFDQAVKEHLETVLGVTRNKKVVTYVTNALRTSEKWDAVLKRVLNIGEAFESLFEDVGLSKKESLRKTLLLDGEEKVVATLEGILSGALEVGTTASEDAIVKIFLREIRQLHDAELRTSFLNRMLLKLVDLLTPYHEKKKPAPIPLLNLFVQFYCYLVTKELIPIADARVKTYLAAHPIDFFTYQLTHLPTRLDPHSNTKQDDFVLDNWQRLALQKIDAGENVVLCAPTSSGKSMMVAKVFDNFRKIVIVVPSTSLGYQMGSIALKTLLNNEMRIGAVRRNFRLELESKRYRRYAKAADDIIVGTPKEIAKLLQSGEISSEQDYVVMDEFHFLQDADLGPSYRKLLWFAAFHKIPIVAASATIGNFDAMKASLETMLHGPLFAINEYKRFFNQKRWTFKTRGNEVSLTELDPLDHITVDMIRSKSFRRIGLYPSQTLQLYQRMPSVPRVDEVTPRLVSLDDVEHTEEAIIRHLQEQEPAVLETIVKGLPTIGDSLTPFQLYKALKEMNNSKKPALVFKMDSKACLRLFQTLIHLIQEYNELIYENFNDDQAIIQEYLEELETMEDADKSAIPVAKSVKDGRGEAKTEDPEEKKRAQKERLFKTKYYPKLMSFHDAYLKVRLTEDGLHQNQPKYDVFNAKYGASLTPKDGVKLKKAHVDKEKTYTFDTIRLRSSYDIHPEAKLTSYSTGHVMKEIRKDINSELEYQTKFNGRFVYEDREFAEFGMVGEAQETKKKVAGAKKAEKAEKPSASASSDEEEDAEAKNAYTYDIPYKHPVMVGIECGLLFYNGLLNPALTRVCQKLISKHPLIVITDHNLAVGMNLPTATVVLVGGLKGEPIEEIDNTLAHQAMGRAGRRGMDTEGHIIYTGVNIAKILTAQYTDILINDPKALPDLLAGESEAFQAFVTTGVRPVEVPKTKVEKMAKATKTANAESNVLVNSIVEHKETDEDQAIRKKKEEEMLKAMETMSWEEYCEKFDE